MQNISPKKCVKKWRQRKEITETKAPVCEFYYLAIREKNVPDWHEIHVPWYFY